MTLRPSHLLFLDTEFTSLGDPWPVHIMSVGLCDAAGEPVFYAELDDFDPSLMSDFTRSRVAPLLQRGSASMPFAEVASKFFAAIADFGHPCALAADSAWDWMWAQAMASGRQTASFGGLLEDPSVLPAWPANLSPALALLAFDDLPMVERAACSLARSEHFALRSPHHAMVDAIANAAACRAAIAENPGLDPLDPRSMCKVFKRDFELLTWTAPFSGSSTGE